MTVSLRNAGLKTEKYKASPIPGVIRTAEDCQSNTHPYPILFTPLYFVCVCIECEKEIAPRRATVVGALYDRLIHSRTHGGN